MNNIKYVDLVRSCSKAVYTIDSKQNTRYSPPLQKTPFYDLAGNDIYEFDRLTIAGEPGDFYMIKSGDEYYLLDLEKEKIIKPNQNMLSEFVVHENLFENETFRLTLKRFLYMFDKGDNNKPEEFISNVIKILNTYTLKNISKSVTILSVKFDDIYITVEGRVGDGRLFTETYSFKELNFLIEPDRITPDGLIIEATIRFLKNMGRIKIK